MRTLLSLLAMIISISAFSQNSGDKKIIVTKIDTTDLYTKVKYSLGKHDFIVRDDGNKDTITTHLRELRTMQGYCRIQVILTSDSAIFYGLYGLKRIDDWGYTTAPKSYKPIIYFKGSKIWPLLLKVASNINGEISFSQ